MRAPEFWHFGAGGRIAACLAPLGAITAALTARRVARAGWRAPVPVICCGNASVGGAGKTTLALDLARRLRARGKHPAFITRGYRGARAATPLRVVPAPDAASRFGDEALLLAAVAPTYVAVDRARAARAALADGADILVMDDGLQNPSLVKTFSLLVVDGVAGFGNGRLLPAGPLREPVAAAASRCGAAVLIGPDRCGARRQLPTSLAVLCATLRSRFDPEAFAGRPLAAFAGIGRPEKFFDTLLAGGADLVVRQKFPDHHRYGEHDLTALLAAADRLGAVAVTTPKDFVRLPARLATRVHAIEVDLVWENPDEIESLLAKVAAA